ncbi:LamG domain-containing protein, partial [bacterium]|nr:LamG domain-containing protein [bacterium]
DDWYWDSTGNSNNLSSYQEASRPTYTDKVPFGEVPVSGITNLLALDFVPFQDLGTFGTNMGHMINTYPFSSGFTVECMVKFNSYWWQVAVGKDGRPAGSGDPTFHIKSRNDSIADHKIHFGFYDTNTTFIHCMSSFNYNTGEWYYIAAVCDGTQAYLYVKEEADADYELESSSPTSGGLLITDGTWTVGRGMWEGNPNDFVNGRIDEVRISDTALNPTQFLGYVETFDPYPPDIKNVQYLPYPDPVDKDNVTIQALITTANSTISNAVLEYSLNSGSYLSLTMATNITPDIYSATIISQTIDTVVDFRIIADNTDSQSATSDVSQYTVKEEILWTSVLVAGDTASGFPGMTSMDVAPNGIAGFVYRQGTNGARYVEESSLGNLDPAVDISTNMQGYISNIRFGSDNEPRVSLSYDFDDLGGVTFVQRTNNAWLSPIVVVSNVFSYDNDRRHSLTLVDNAPTVLWYENYQNSGTPGKLCTGNIAGDSFTYIEVESPAFAPTFPRDSRKPFMLATDSEWKRHIAIQGPGDGPDFLYYGVETAKGSGSFGWEQVPIDLTHSNAFAEQIGFTLDNNDKPYIVVRDYNSDPNYAALYYNTDGSWIKQLLSPQGFWSRAAVAYDSWNDCMWVAHSSAGEGGNLLRLWSSRSGNWKQEQTITNGPFIETISGFGVTDEGVMKLAFTPAVDSTDLVYMYSTTFSDIPEPGMIIGGIAIALLAFRRK